LALRVPGLSGPISLGRFHPLAATRGVTPNVPCRALYLITPPAAPGWPAWLRQPVAQPLVEQAKHHCRLLQRQLPGLIHKARFACGHAPGWRRRACPGEVAPSGPGRECIQRLRLGVAALPGLMGVRLWRMGVVGARRRKLVARMGAREITDAADGADVLSRGRLWVVVMAVGCEWRRPSEPGP